MPYVNNRTEIKLGIQKIKRISGLTDLQLVVWVCFWNVARILEQVEALNIPEHGWARFQKRCLPSETGADPGFGQGGGTPATETESCRHSEVSNLRLGSRARLTALETFGFLMPKYAFSHILEALFLLFLTSILTSKVDQNRTLDCTSINLRHSYIPYLFLIFIKKLCFDSMTWWGMPSKVRLANFMT